MNTCLACTVMQYLPVGRAGVRADNILQYIFIRVLLMLVFPGFSQAGSFSVMPLRVELSAHEATRIITLQNLDTKPVTVQLQLMAWSHKEGVDRFTPTRDIIVTPQVFHLKANSVQIIRAGLVRTPDSHDELAYRLFIEEIPEPPPADFKGAQIALKISLPVFVAPEKPASQALEFQTTAQRDGTINVRVVNHGRAHAQIHQLSVFSGESTESSIARHEKTLYVLPRQERSLVLKADMRELKNIDKFLVTATTRNGPIESHVSAGSP